MTIILEDWATIAQAKQQRNLDLIPAGWRVKSIDSVHVLDVPATCGILNATELRVTETPAQALVIQMRQGVLKSYDVVTAFAKRAAIAHQLASLYVYPELMSRRIVYRKSTLRVPSPKRPRSILSLARLVS
jgi:amidase